jgi:uncharacterized protein (TIGR00299 family) protein
MSSTLANQHIHLDLVGGIAGDMFVSALLDMQPALQEQVESALALVLPDEAGKPLISRGLNAGISGLHFSLKPKELNAGSSEHSHTHEHTHEHTHDNTPHQHTHTTYRYLCGLIEQSPLATNIVKRAIHLLSIIAKAEAKIHGTSLEHVHFHELADWDSLMDVVASAVIIETLPEHTWSISALPLGGGLVNTQHGLIPVPAPATAEILVGFKFNDDGVKGERITPTGAAILRCLSELGKLKSHKGGELVTCGYGLGTKILKGMPNILRANLFESPITTSSQPTEHTSVVSIEFDIDDMTGEEIGLAADLIRAHSGVLDLVIQSARGKKNRGVELFRVLTDTQQYQNVIDYIFTQTTTIGLRYRFDSRVCLPRQYTKIHDTPCKLVTRPNSQITCKIEHDQLLAGASLAERRENAAKINPAKK